VDAGDLNSYLEQVLVSVMLADSNGQLRQQRLWLEISQGVPLLEGVDREASLAIRDVKLSFTLAPVPPSPRRRIWNRTRRWAGLSQTAPRGARFQLGRAGEGVKVEVTVPRSTDGAWRARSTPAPDDESVRAAAVQGLPS
jgi:hypothetical protein